MPRSLHTGRSVVSSNSSPPLELMLKATLLAVGLDVLSTMLSDIVPCDAGITCHTVHYMPTVELTGCYQLCHSCVANFKHSHPLRLSIGIGCGERHSPSCQRGKASSLSSTTCACHVCHAVLVHNMDPPGIQTVPYRGTPRFQDAQPQTTTEQTLHQGTFVHIDRMQRPESI